MHETTALDKHACAACGAPAEWSPAKQALVCVYCGTIAPGELDRDTGKIQENDLVRALREIPDEQRGWLTDKRAVRCRSCEAVTVFDPGRVGQSCEFCGSPELLDYEEIKAPIRPESLLPFKVSQSDAGAAVRRWYAGRWFAPSRLKKAGIDKVQGLFLPYWSFDARARCPWTAQSGYYYYTTESFRDAQGRQRTRRVRHVRWRPSAGEIEHFFDDQPIPATRGIDHGLLRGIEPFPTSELVPYDTAFLSGFSVEHYQIVLVEAARRARESMDEQLRLLCSRQVPGDTFRDLVIEPQYSGQTFKHLLVPVWLAVYHYRAKPYQVLVNGNTRKTAGRYPKSPWKILALALLIGTLVLAVVLLSR